MLAAIRSVLTTLIAVLLALAIGAYCGSAFGYAIAYVADRDPAELKDMLIWCMIGTASVFAAGAILSATVFFSVRRWLIITAGVLFCLVMLASIGITILAYIEAPRYGPKSTSSIEVHSSIKV